MIGRVSRPARYPQIKRLLDPGAFAARLHELGIDIPISSAPPAPVLGSPFRVGDRTVGNRFAVLPMEGWDGATDGQATAEVTRRWGRFGASGAKLIWGGEAVAVRADGRANPRQLLIDGAGVEGLAALRAHLVQEHVRAHEALGRHGSADDLLVGLQLTHSGRFARPAGVAAPRTAYEHPVLDGRVGADATSVLHADELAELVERFVDAAALAHEAGYDFVDVKQCHGYLGHELLSAFDRDDRYGGDFEGRTRFVTEVITGVRARVPSMMIGSRVSVFDVVPFVPGADGVGTADPATPAPYACAFGGDGTVVGADLEHAGHEAHRLVEHLAALGVTMVCVTAGSPYYNPHIQRPAYFPPSDGYLSPEDPLVGVARLLHAARALRARHPDMVVVGSGLSYLQEWIPPVATALVEQGWMDAVGLGRMAISYPTLPADVLGGDPLDARSVCRTFSDCTTAPRHGLVSGCYPLDPYYRDRPERVQLAAVKKERRDARAAPLGGAVDAGASPDEGDDR